VPVPRKPGDCLASCVSAILAVHVDRIHAVIYKRPLTSPRVRSAWCPDPLIAEAQPVVVEGLGRCVVLRPGVAPGVHKDVLRSAAVSRLMVLAERRAGSIPRLRAPTSML
jgi:hypothetical protein